MLMRITPLFIGIILVATSYGRGESSSAPAPVPTRVSHRIELKSGDVFVAPILEQSETEIVLDHPLAGRLVIAIEQVKGVDQPAVEPAPMVTTPTPVTVPAPIPVAAAPETPATPLPQPGPFDLFIKEWKPTIAFGFNIRNSNTDTADVNAGLTLNRSNEKERTKVDAKYFYASVNNKVSRQDTHIDLTQDWLIPESPWFLFAQGGFDQDDYKSWMYRMRTHGGLGYDLKKATGIDAKLRGGFGVTREFGGVDPDTRLEGLAGGEIFWQINPIHAVAANVQYFPGLADIAEYRMRTTGDWTIKLSKELSLKLGVWNEYDSTEPVGFVKNDLRVYGSMVFGF